MQVIPLSIDNDKEAKELISSLGVSQEGVEILWPKAPAIVFKITNIRSWEANIIKQHMLSLGADAALAREVLVKDIETQVLLLGTKAKLLSLCHKLKDQPFKLKIIAQELENCLANLAIDKYQLKFGNKQLNIDKPVICGIINLTADSFSGDGLLTKSRCDWQDNLIRKVEDMVSASAKIIDFGGQSSRPFSKPIPVKEEIKRLIPAIKLIRKKFKDIIISLDSYRYQVVEQAIDWGVDIVNDITALRAEPKIAKLIKQYKLGCILMHMKGMPATMQVNPKYENIIEDIAGFFKQRLDFCQKQGINKEQLIIDPGIGFGKALEDNLKLINKLDSFKMFGMPILIGLSRKAFIGKLLDLAVEDRLIGTVASNVLALTKGARIFRVHDVKECKQALDLAYQIIKPQGMV